MLPNYFDYSFVHLRQKTRLGPEKPEIFVNFRPDPKSPAWLTTLRHRSRLLSHLSTNVQHNYAVYKVCDLIFRYCLRSLQRPGFKIHSWNFWRPNSNYGTMWPAVLLNFRFAYSTRAPMCSNLDIFLWIKFRWSSWGAKCSPICVRCFLSYKFVDWFKCEKRMCQFAYRYLICQLPECAKKCKSSNGKN